MTRWAGLLSGLLVVWAHGCGGGGPKQEPAAVNMPRVRYEPVPVVELQSRVADLSWDEPDQSPKNWAGFYLVKLRRDVVGDRSAVVAVRMLCTYRGCTPNMLVSDGLVLCPCFGSRFEFSGKLIKGPAPESLARYGIALDEGTSRITVDKRKTYSYEKGEWSDPASFSVPGHDSTEARVIAD